MFFVFIDLFLNIYSSSKYEKKYLNTLIKNKIGITKRQVPTYRKLPERLEPILNRKIISIEESIELFNNSNQHQIVTSLDAISKISANHGLQIISLAISDSIGIKLKNVNDFESTKSYFTKIFNIDSEDFNDGKLGAQSYHSNKGKKVSERFEFFVKLEHWAEKFSEKISDSPLADLLSDKTTSLDQKVKTNLTYLFFLRSCSRSYTICFFVVLINQNIRAKNSRHVNLEKQIKSVESYQKNLDGLKIKTNSIIKI